MNELSIFTVQNNPIVGNIQYNLELAKEEILKGYKEKADLVVFSECFITGYSVEDLVFNDDFLKEAHDAVLNLRDFIVNNKLPAIIIGSPYKDYGKIYNSGFFIEDTGIIHRVDKHQLPNYGVFDEKRHFTEGSVPNPITYKGFNIGLLICEDIWFDTGAWNLGKADAHVIISINGSPFEINKDERRKEVIYKRVINSGTPVIYVNQFGGQDEIVYDGGSFAYDKNDGVIVQNNFFAPDNMLIKVSKNKKLTKGKVSNNNIPSKNEMIYSALVLGLRDYVNKNGFPGVVLGVSGGIDSALAATIAVDALGNDRVWGIMMPYKYTSDESLKDAKDLTDNLNMKYNIVPIHEVIEQEKKLLKGLFNEDVTGITLENLQARERGKILMAASNKTGYLVLATGNKSEFSVGYATLYGDMCGGYSPLKDVYKTTVFELSKFRNECKPLIALGSNNICVPENTITRPPSAELSEDQKDTDSLPDYDTLDAILKSLIENSGNINLTDYDNNIVNKVRSMLFKAEYKRRQAAPGIKITPMQFGTDRRYPITNGFNVNRN